MDEQQDSSMGLIIAIVAGGVVLVLVALLVVGGGFFFMASHHDVAFAPVAVEDRAPDMVIAGDGPAPPPPQPNVDVPVKPAIKDAAPRTRLIGVWETKTKDGGRVTLEFAADDTYGYVAVPPKGSSTPAAVASWRWELVSHQDNQAVIHRIIGAVASPREIIAFNDDGSITLSGADCFAPGTYQRKEEKKP